MIDEMVTLLKAEQSEDDSRKEYCIKSFDETRGRGQRSSHKDAVKSCKDQMSNTDDRVEALNNSTDERDSSVSWSRRVSGIATRGSKCYLRIVHHHTHRMAGRECVLKIMHYYSRKCTTITLRAMHAVTVSTRQRLPRNSRKHWTRHRVGALMHHHLEWCITQRSNVTTTATRRHDHNNATIEQVNTAVTESAAKRTKHSDTANKGQERTGERAEAVECRPQLVLEAEEEECKAHTRGGPFGAAGHDLRRLRVANRAGGSAVSADRCTCGQDGKVGDGASERVALGHTECAGASRQRAGASEISCRRRYMN